MAGDVVIRPAEPPDLPDVAMLFREYVAALGVDLSFQGFDAEVTSLPGAYAPPSGALLVAVSTRAIGCVAVRPLPEDGVCEMKRLYAAPSARGYGLGRKLATAAIDAATRARHRIMRLDTLPAMAAAQALYRDLGFETIAAYYNSSIPGTIFMQKRLVSLV